MIHIFNRREVAVTYDMKRQYEVRTKLEENRIPYVTAVRSNHSWERRYTGLFGAKYPDEYKIYVHKKDYEKAVFVLSQR